MAVIYYGDMLVTLREQTEPYELNRGDAEACREVDRDHTRLVPRR